MKQEKYQCSRFKPEKKSTVIFPNEDQKEIIHRELKSTNAHFIYMNHCDLIE